MEDVISIARDAILDLHRERDQLKERVRELEAELLTPMILYGHRYVPVERLELVIKDKEAYWQNRATTAEEKVKNWSVRACEGEERINKAREILESVKWNDDGPVQRALKALEGK